jgi:hypothetical protein
MREGEVLLRCNEIALSLSLMQHFGGAKGLWTIGDLRKRRTQ